MSDCTECLPGQYCKEGDTVPDPCPAGYWCLLGEQDPKECPTRTYTDDEWITYIMDEELDGSQGITKGVGYEYQCESCPEGYICDEEGTDSLEGNECPASRFCYFRAEIAISCMSGTYTVSEASDPSDCITCQEGYSSSPFIMFLDIIVRQKVLLRNARMENNVMLDQLPRLIVMQDIIARCNQQ